MFPVDPSKGHQTYTLTKNVYIETDDFSESVVKGFYGIMPDQIVCLRYGPFVKLVKVIKDQDGKIQKVQVEAVDKPESKVKGVIHWVSKEHSLPCLVNQYEVLFLAENVIEAAGKQNVDITKLINPDNLKRRPNARIWDLHKNVKPFDRFQFERVGFFCCDEESTPQRLAFNSIVSLKESSAKVKGKQ